MFKDFKEEIKSVVRLGVSATQGRIPVRWLQNIPVFKTVLEYENLFRLAWSLYISGGDRRVASKDCPTVSGPAGPAAPDQSGVSKDCKHFKKFGICKFGGEEQCRNGLHPVEFRKSAGNSALVPKIPAPLPLVVLPAGDPDTIVKDCRRCQLPFSESEKY